MVANPICLLLIRTDHIRKPAETQENAWIQQMMIKGGIDINGYKPHRLAEATNAYLVENMQTAGRSSGATFAKFYDRKIEQGSSFADSVLSLSLNCY